MSNITPFRDSIIPGHPVPDVVADLERLLADAKSGRLRAIAYATVAPPLKGTGWSGDNGTSDAVAAAITMLAHRYAEGLLE